jgi:hypothetical protein
LEIFRPRFEPQTLGIPLNIFIEQKNTRLFYENDTKCNTKYGYTYAAVRNTFEHLNIYRGQSEYTYVVAVLYVAQMISEAYEAGWRVTISVPCRDVLCRYGNNSNSGGMKQGKQWCISRLSAGPVQSRAVTGVICSKHQKGWGAPHTPIPLSIALTRAQQELEN